KIRELEEQVKILMTHINPQINISNVAGSVSSQQGNTLVGNTIGGDANLSNQLTYQTQYIQNYQKLESDLEEQITEPLTSQETTLQERKVINKTILFLGTKELFINYRQASINSLIDCYNKLEKSGSKLTRFANIASMMNITGKLANIIPGGGIAESSLGLAGDAINLAGTVIEGTVLK